MIFYAAKFAIFSFLFQYFHFFCQQKKSDKFFVEMKYVFKFAIDNHITEKIGKKGLQINR